jgi:hypothetical protein
MSRGITMQVLVPLGSTISIEFEPANGRKFPSNQLAYPHTWLSFFE